MSKAAEACRMPTLKAVKKNNGLGWQASRKKGEVSAIPLANYLPALEPEHDKSKD
ncbi:hypothetical protein GCM10011529_31620 [Polymorphobacter glacialis]|uniref:Uncharacterized protein n=1 Tax=Sandarakinorhabdus glacialis TaxID=1614636 RepID=A0A917A1Y7_9SPHN|nr:hypothetical protein [Polymorphobacter glacialis]GGE22687.1 hypothetical protein GCM10011529_31620 [Polymorphobacter glacialis]